MSERDEIARLMSVSAQPGYRWGSDPLSDMTALRVADAILAAGYTRTPALPAEGSPEDDDLVERLENGVPACGMHDDNETELFQVEDANETMAEAAEEIARLTAELAAEREKVATLRETSRLLASAREASATVGARVHLDGVEYSIASLIAEIIALRKTVATLREALEAIARHDPDEWGDAGDDMAAGFVRDARAALAATSTKTPE